MSTRKEFQVWQLTMYENLEKNQETEISFKPVVV